MKPSVIHHNMAPGRRDPLALAAADVDESLLRTLPLLGIGLPAAKVRGMIQDLGLSQMAMDDSQPLVTTASVVTPIQFLQAWLPGFVHVMTQARVADEILGVQTIGSWEDEEVIQGILEPVGEAELYGDLTNIPLASWNTNFERRTVVRWEKGFMVGVLEEARAARMRVNSAAEKRNAVALALEILRNRVAFLGFNGGTNRTYGYLNDPSLPAYVTVAATGTGSSPLWSTKTFLNITADIREAAAALRTRSGSLIDPQATALTLTVAADRVDFLTVTSDFGISVRDWIAKTFPKMRVVSAPELSGANGGASVFYLHADSVADSGSDGGQVWAQMVPAKFQALGTEKRAKGYVEDFSNALAGVLLKRPYAVVRRSGI